MAYWMRRGKNKAVYVYTFKEGAVHQLERGMTRHLDAQDDSNVRYWVQNYELTHEAPKRDLATTVADRDLQGLIDAYITFLAGRRRAKATQDQHRLHLTRDVIPYFISVGCLDPNTWPERAFDLHDHLAGREKDPLGPSQIFRANIALRGLWQWLRGKRRILPSLQLNLLNPPGDDKVTPLPAHITPDEAFGYALLAPTWDLRVLALMGYFFSLRPQETYGLRVTDFVGGERALALEAGRVMARHGRYGRLCVHVERQRDKKLRVGPTKKKEHKGWVACTHEDAAALLVATIKSLPPDAFLISQWGPDGAGKAWRRKGIKANVRQDDGTFALKTITLKDLRRASLYWLGHNTSMNQAELKNHARHTRAETTALYTRRVDENVPMDQRGLAL